MKVMSLVVNSRDTCEEIFSVDDLRKNGIDLTSSDLKDLESKLKNNFTSEVTCMGNDFDISEGWFLIDTITNSTLTDTSSI